jgi:chromosome partitioning protein
MTAPRCIAVAGRKGGVGKTTIVCGLASIFLHRGLRVLVIDLDPQSNAAFALGVDPAAPGTAAFLTDGAIPVQAGPNLRVLAGGPGLTEAKVQRLHPEDLADAVSRFEDVDVVICDCPPGIEHLERLGLTAADTALVVADAHPFAALGAGRVLEDLAAMRERGRRSPTRWALVMSRIDTRRSADRRMTDNVSEAFPDVARLQVHQDTALANATSDQVLVMQVAPKSRGVEDLCRIADWATEAAASGHRSN